MWSPLENPRHDRSQVRHVEGKPNPPVGDAIDLLLWMPRARCDKQRLLAAELDDDTMRAALVLEMRTKRTVQEPMHVQVCGHLEGVSA